MRTLPFMRHGWAVLVWLGAVPVFGAIQPAWIVRYSASPVGCTNQPVAMALDGQGNIIVTGSSTAARGDFDYVTVKYAPSGTRLWLARYASLGSGNDQPRALVLDREGSVYVTGTSATVKYDPDGTQQWEAPDGGRGLTVDTNGNVYVTGYSTEDFATVKLSATGSNVWARTHDRVGQRDISDAVEVDAEGSVYVGGRESWVVGYPYSRWAVIKYRSDGASVWTNTTPPAFIWGSASVSDTCVKELQVANDGELYLLANLFGGSGRSFYAAKLRTDTGQLEWMAIPETTDLEGATAGVVDSLGNSYLTGRLIRLQFVLVSYATFKISSAGTVLWEASYTPTTVGYHIANVIALDAAGNVYVTGQSVNSNGDDDWATIKYNPDGKEQWVRRHDGPLHAHDEANAIAVDPSGNVYVAGSQTTSNNVVELVLIKYSELENIRLLPDNWVVLQFFATPGLVCRFQGTTNFPNWTDLGSSVADFSGIARFEDTNAPAYPHRFYRFVSP